jgi:hypothetical protein
MLRLRPTIFRGLIDLPYRIEGRSECRETRPEAALPKQHKLVASDESPALNNCEEYFMKRLFALPFAVLSSLPVISVAHALTPAEEFFVSAAKISSVISEFCPDISVVSSELDRLGDRNGIETDKIRAAIAAATNASEGRPYIRVNLISGVTQLLNRLDKELAKTLESDRSGTCKEWSETFLTMGVVRRGK